MLIVVLSFCRGSHSRPVSERAGTYSTACSLRCGDATPNHSQRIVTQNRTSQALTTSPTGRGTNKARLIEDNQSRNAVSPESLIGGKFPVSHQSLQCASTALRDMPPIRVCYLLKTQHRIEPSMVNESIHECFPPRPDHGISYSHSRLCQSLARPPLVRECCALIPGSTPIVCPVEPTP